MTKRTFLTSFAALALVATASMVMAQPGGGQRGQGGQGRQGQAAPAGGGIAATQILAIADARTALGVTDEQYQKVQDAIAAVPAPQRVQGQGQQMTAEQRAERMQTRQAAIRKALTDNLSAAVVEKIDVMAFQRAGGINPPAAPAAGAPGGGAGFGGGFGGGLTLDTLRALKLTDDQTAKVQEAITKRTAAMPAFTGGPNATPPTAEERQAQAETRRKANEEFLTALKGVLTDAQKSNAEELMKDVPSYLTRRPGGGPGAANRGAGGGRGNRTTN